MKGKIGILAAMCSVLLTGCGQPEQAGTVSAPQKEDTAKKTELNMLYSGEDASRIGAIEELCENFMKENPDITLNLEHSGSGFYTETLKEKEATNEFPDIFEIQDPNTFLAAGKLGAISKDVGDLVEQPFTVDGAIYALPFYKSSSGIIYNQVLFKKYDIAPPRTYEEFLLACRTLKENGVAPLAAGGSRTDTGKYWMNYFFYTNVTKVNPQWQEQRTAKQTSFQEEAMQKVLTEYQDLMNGEYVLEDSINRNENQILEALINQEVAMIYAEPVFFAKMMEAYPLSVESGKTTMGEELSEDPSAFRLGWFFMPDKEGSPVVISETGASWAISDVCGKDPAKQEAAMEFFRFCYRKENYRKILKSVYAIPATKEKILYPAPAVQQDFLVNYRYADKTEVYLGNEDTPENFRRNMYDVLYSVAAKTMSVETAAQKLDENWDSALQE